MTKNFYPELPEILYKRTSVEMPLVALFAKSLVNKYFKETLAMAYAIFRNESANGTKGVNNNYAGIQADNARWKDLPREPIATCIKIDSGKQERRFLCFKYEDGYKVSFELLCVKISQRNMKTADDYFANWVGRKGTEEEVKNFNSLLRSGQRLFE